MVLDTSGVIGGRRRGASVKTLKRALKKAGLKTTGRKAALTRRAKKAHLKVRGGGDDDDLPVSSGPESLSPPGWGWKGSEEKKAVKAAEKEELPVSSGPESFSPPGWGWKGSEEKKAVKKGSRRHRSRKH